MSSILSVLPQLYAEYTDFVAANPRTTNDCETAAKWISYFIAGKVNNSHILSELVFSLSNLLVLYNDRIINKGRGLDPPTSGDHLKLWLTVVEYSEVFLELSAQKCYGDRGKWVIITAVQLFKFISRLSLVYKHNENIVLTPPIPPLDRRRLASADHQQWGGSPPPVDDVSFTLKHSGRVIRRVEYSPSLNSRSWKPLLRSSTQHHHEGNEETVEQALAGRQLVAETIYILKPIVHLAAVGACGNNTWKPWMVALVMDMVSLHLYSGSGANNNINKGALSSLTAKQKLQIARRKYFLLLYLLRSPFYERHTKERIHSLLVALSKNVPFAKMICLPLIQYLVYYQSKYFYLWST